MAFGLGSAHAFVNHPGEGLFHSPTLAESMIKGAGVNPQFFGPLRYAHGFAIVGKEASSTCVAGLLFCACPAAVVWRIWSIIVNAVKLVVRRGLRSQIFVEVYKGLAPEIAHRYPSGTITRVVGRVGVVAALQHAGPSSVFWRAILTVFRKKGFGYLISQATTAFRLAAPQLVVADDTIGATCANTRPMTTSSVSFRFGNHRPTPDSAPREVVRYSWDCHHLQCDGRASGGVSRAGALSLSIPNYTTYRYEGP